MAETPETACDEVYSIGPNETADWYCQTHEGGVNGLLVGLLKVARHWHYAVRPICGHPDHENPAFRCVLDRGHPAADACSDHDVLREFTDDEVLAAYLKPHLLTGFCVSCGGEHVCGGCGSGTDQPQKGCPWCTAREETGR